MKLEAGKFYRTQSGAKAHVCGQCPWLKEGRDWVGFVEGTETPVLWTQDGDCLFSVLDIVAKWVEPKRIKGWACISKAKFHHASLCCVSDVFASPEEAIAACAAPIACIEIDVLEGAGLEVVR